MIVLWFLIGFVVIGLAVMFLIAMLGDWDILARNFRAHHKPGGAFYYMQSVGIGTSSYRNMLTVGITSEGLYLAVFFPFRLFHPPLLIPWSEITEVHENKFLSWRTYRLAIGSPEWAHVTVREDLMNEMQRYLADTSSNLPA